MRRIAIVVRLFLQLLLCMMCANAFAQEAADPIFALKAIQNDPLDAKVLKTTEDDGLVIQEVEYNGPVLDGKPVRIFGILAYPKGGTKLPAIFWSQNGMAPAGDYFPKVFAKKGYFCLNVTLDHGVWNSFAPFDTANPKQANLTQLANVQMRGITYMTTRPEIDVDRIGVAGGSYGGFFATLIAGADPRVKAGMSFFASGNHQLGTNLPQFNQLSTLAEAEVWQRTIDPAWRLKKRAVPFCWGVGSNDHWFELPAIFKTYEESAGEKALAIAIPWAHAGPANMDDQLINWFDSYLTKTKPPLNSPGTLQVKVHEGKLIASWDWKGERPVAKAEIVASYGPAKAWHQWIHRSHTPWPATISGNTAVGEIPVPEPGLEIFCYGLITDDSGAMCVTLPQTVSPSELGLTAATLGKPLNLFTLGEFEAADFEFFTRSGEPAGTADTNLPQAGKQSTKLTAGQGLPLKLFHVPSRSHKLSLWIRAEQADTVQVEVVGLPPANQQSKLVQQLRTATATPDLPAGDGQSVPLSFKTEAQAGTEWKQFTLDCPYENQPISGYQLVITPGKATCWIDSVRFEPVWK